MSISLSTSSSLEYIGLSRLQVELTIAVKFGELAFYPLAF